MDPRRNPYTPGAGTAPPELAGRDAIIAQAEIDLARIRAGYTAQGTVFYGLRGVGKTVLLNRISRDAEAEGFATASIEASESRPLSSQLIPVLRKSLLRLSAGQKLKGTMQRAMRALGGYVKSLKSIKVGDIEVNLDFSKEFGAERGLADSGNLSDDLTDLLAAFGAVAAERKTAVVFFIDELQYVAPSELSALLSAMHRLAQERVPVTMIGAGLPQIVGQSSAAKSYAERLLRFIKIDSLDETAARLALIKPAEKENVAYEESAIARIIEETRGYPYFLQEWGKHSWEVAARSPITLADVKQATEQAILELDSSFFRARFDRLTPKEKTYVFAMARLGPGSQRSGDIAKRLRKRVTELGPVRSSLIKKGVIYSPAHGDNGFTVPLFDRFLKRNFARGT